MGVSGLGCLSALGVMGVAPAIDGTGGSATGGNAPRAVVPKGRAHRGGGAALFVLSNLDPGWRAPGL